jgi:hypothetical protein
MRKDPIKDDWADIIVNGIIAIAVAMFFVWIFHAVF